jgi:hypothetical protein
MLFPLSIEGSNPIHIPLWPFHNRLVPINQQGASRLATALRTVHTFRFSPLPAKDLGVCDAWGYQWIAALFADTCYQLSI